MTRTRANSGQAAKRPVAATPGASLPLDASLLSIIANLEGLDLKWVAPSMAHPFGGEAPAHLPRWLLIRVLAYRLQSDAFGDLDKSIRRILRSGKEDGVGAPFDRREPQTREGLGLKVGALLVRTNRRDFLVRRIARHFRGLWLQSSVCHVHSTVSSAHWRRVGSRVSGRKFPFPRLLFATCPPRPTSNGNSWLEPRHLTRFGWMDQLLAGKPTSKGGWLVTPALASAVRGCATDPATPSAGRRDA
jgi:hypothetical protein